MPKLCLNISPPPMIKISLVSASQARSRASSIEWATAVSPAFQSLSEVTTILMRPGRSSKVFRPMIMGMAQVVFLKKRKSSGSFQGNPPALPITLFSDAATICDMIRPFINLISLNSYRSFDAGMILIIFQCKILKPEICNISHLRIQLHHRQRIRSAR